MLDALVCCAADDGRSYLYYWFLANKLPECCCRGSIFDVHATLWDSSSLNTVGLCCSVCMSHLTCPYNYSCHWNVTSQKILSYTLYLPLVVSRVIVFFFSLVFYCLLFHVLIICNVCTRDTRNEGNLLTYLCSDLVLKHFNMQDHLSQCSVHIYCILHIWSNVFPKYQKCSKLNKIFMTKLFDLTKV